MVPLKKGYAKRIQQFSLQLGKPRRKNGRLLRRENILDIFGNRQN
jgi:hypothetical protein